MKLKEIREMYPEGTQIVLTEMAGESQMPYGLKGTVKFVDDAGQIHMSWENGSSLALNIHKDTFEKVEAPEKISVILVEPGRYPKLIEIEDTLEAMQSLVEGDIEEYMPFEDEVAIICNDEGKMNGLPLNRAVYSEPENVEMSYPQLKAHFDPAETVIDACFNHNGEDEKVLRAKQILTQLKITDLTQPMGQLSGGQQKRVALANVLITEPDFIILDEPTNHLDLKMIEWLENFLNRGNRTLLMVTHDRYFLDNVCNVIVELDDKTIYTYHGNKYKNWRKEYERKNLLQCRGHCKNAWCEHGEIL